VPKLPIRTDEITLPRLSSAGLETLSPYACSHNSHEAETGVAALP